MTLQKHSFTAEQVDMAIDFLVDVHDAVAGHFESSEDAFRLRVLRLLEPSKEPPRKLDVGRPAKLYRRKGTAPGES